ncbi:unnamed protein product [Urochloa humidicola]
MPSSSSYKVQDPLLLPATADPSAQAASTFTMVPEMLMAARSGDIKLLGDLLNREDAEAATQAGPVVVDVVEGNLPIRPAPTTLPALPAVAAAALAEVTTQGDSVLHVVAASGDGQEFLQCAELICNKANNLLHDSCNKNGDTPLHCAARAGNVAMVSHLISLAQRGHDGEVAARALLRKHNRNGETVLHEAVRLAMDDDGLVKLLMSVDPELARVPGIGTSALYLAISLGRGGTARLLHDRDGGLSYSGPDGQSALHAAVLKGKGMTKMLLEWNKDLAKQVDGFGDTPLHVAASVERSGMETVLGSSFWFFFSSSMYGMTELLVDSNISCVYQADKEGSFPIHVAATMGRLKVIKILLDKCPDCAGLLDGKGRTFLHVAVVKKRHSIVAFACKDPQLASILNMRDDDLNTALHLAIYSGDLRSFDYLICNRKVLLNLANSKGHTPLDVSESVVNHAGIHYGSNAQSWIRRLLVSTTNGCNSGRQDRFQDTHVPKLNYAEESRKMTDSTQYLGISSVLIVTITFAAAFAPPGGYIEDDHPNAGTATLAGSYAFDAFVISNTMANICSSLATFGLMYSGMTAVDFSIGPGTSLGLSYCYGARSGAWALLSPWGYMWHLLQLLSPPPLRFVLSPQPWYSSGIDTLLTR